MLSVESKEWLSSRFKDAVLFNEPMNRHTWYKIGGPADALVRPLGIDDVVALVKWCALNRVPYMVVGNGSNLLVRDGGIRGVVIVTDKCLDKMMITDSTRDKVRVCASAGVKLPKLCRFAMENGLEGLNFAVGIPGTVGGGIMMNAGAHDAAMADVVDAVRVLWPSGKTEELMRDRLAFSYRSLSVKGVNEGASTNPLVLLDAGFCLRPADKEALKAQADIFLRQRRASQPIDARSAGCFFKNPESGPSAGFLIDKAGLKGARVNDAVVSHRHANFIINDKNASANDVIRLMEHIQDVVYRKYHVFLKPEVKIVGEK